MSEMKAVGSFDKEKGTLTIVLDLTGHSPIEHEMLAAAFDEESEVSQVIQRAPSPPKSTDSGEILRAFRMGPTHDGDQLSATITIYDPGLWDRAVRAETNRQRVANGLPTLDQEEAQAVARKQREASDQAAREDAAEAQVKADADAADAKRAEQEEHDRRLAATVASAVASELKKS